MTAPTKTKDKGTALERLLAVAQSPAERAKAFEMADRLEQSRVIGVMMAEAKAKQWGDKVSPVLRQQLIRWCLFVGADPMTECDVLGGNPYLNARYWQRLAASHPGFLRAEEEFVHDDPRADPEERERRKQLRVKHAIPDAIAATVGLHRNDRAAAQGKPDIPVKAAVIVTLFFKDRGPFIGKKWCPSRAVDDVGIDFPELTAVTRAWRRAAIQGIPRENPFSAKLKSLIAEHRSDQGDGGDAELAQVVALEPGPSEQIDPIEKPPEPGEGQDQPGEPAAPTPPSPAGEAPAKKGDLI